LGKYGNDSVILGKSGIAKQKLIILYWRKDADSRYLDM
jgi:hypothetical protein